MDIQKLPPEQRAKTISEFKEHLMKEQGLMNPAQPVQTVNPSPAS